MALSREEVLKIAKLSRLEFKDEEIERFQEDLNNIFVYIDELNQVDTSMVEPLTQITLETSDFREDFIKKSLTQEESMKNSPNQAEGMLIVPKVVGGED
ncbi:MAG: Asp-tRNA(Asn)/Glu-tRNA(Gln) amidotransferase subunit GatC [Fusobacteriaceae bacterium]